MIAKIAIVAAASIASAVLANKTLIEKNAAQQDSIKKLVEFNEYLANKLDDANVTLDEFDKIAINTIVS